MKIISVCLYSSAENRGNGENYILLLLNLRLLLGSDLWSGQTDLIIIFIIQGHRTESSAVPRGRTQTFGGSANYSSKQKLSLRHQGVSEQYQRNSSETKGKALLVCSSGNKINEGHFRVV